MAKRKTERMKITVSFEDALRQVLKAPPAHKRAQPTQKKGKAKR
jgi:hypothetical protein